MSGMGRREFVALVGNAAAWPLSASAQQPPERMRRIGIIDDAPMWNAFRHGLRELGYLEGQNIAFDYKYADGVPERLAKAAAELVAARSNLSRLTARHRAGQPRMRRRPSRLL
jgi:putative ABC transport system substrate-binding protein